ncbi:MULTISPECIES: branched-chain amino acid ABC transporter permease [unclassified Paenibacillus]|uniref:branched-chain amino acid ABC transporter permease n=1 Tax=unclassified Paenibacillus TaxID=185978 RepID=UPI001AE11144|nr:MULTISPECIES: branched-chain amino acid ABC transporter permease [unclassified Paenibacillus]MBP1154464.1 branched-chain amino acid transport system permease protein [Paenibacillus sp. PvP091]MBP1170152.1 branched-chain amino acid transport system permease protein [Paenibacillus sp. PvR098]MBP2441180.1 branched-chain amino acid transport system permease protein [Paenibacillus sp. PvP052]
MEWLLFIAGLLALAGIYAMLSLTLNIDSGFLGLWNLGVAGFLAVGAYTYTLVTLDQPGTLGLGMPIWVGLLAAAIASGVAGLIVGLPSLRLKKEYLLITTFAFAEVIRQVITNEKWLTNGNIGFYGLPKPFESYFSGINYIFFFTVLVLVILAIYFWLAQRLTYSPLGRLMRAIRENESATLSIGKDIYRTKLKIFILTNMFVGIVGAIYVWYSSIILPSMFTSTITFTVWTALVIGGIGNNKGAVIGAIVLIFVQEFTRFFQVSPDMAVVLASLRWVVIGFMLVFVLRFRPQGILSEKIPSVETRMKLFNGNFSNKGVDFHSKSQSFK